MTTGRFLITSIPSGHCKLEIGAAPGAFEIGASHSFGRRIRNANGTAFHGQSRLCMFIIVVN